jgi:carbonic anhydrase
VVRKRVATVSPDTQKRLAEAEAKAARLAEENAHLQQEVAKAQGLASAPITTPDAALAELKAGNGRFISGKRVRTLLASQDADLRATLAKGQAPFAIIVTCSDSRLMDNLIFDQELGRLFTIREAGNSPDIQGIASAEYAAEHLGSKLVVVLGHTSCGAIKAVAESHGKPLPGNLWSLQAAMAGLLEACHEDPNLPASAYYTQLAEVNAQRQARAMLDRSEILRELVSGGKLKVLPAVYELGSGQVRFLELPAVKAESGH